MKRYILLLLLCSPSALFAQSDTLPAGEKTALSLTQWERANTAYINASYREAIAIYDSLLASGERSHKLWYNLGNACFKERLFGRAVLCYNKALKLSPTDADARYNLAVVNSHLRDRIEQVPQFFVLRWTGTLASSLSGNAWTWIGLGLFAAMLAGVVVCLLPGRMGRRKAGFWSALACAALFTAATIFALRARAESLHPTRGVVMSSAVAVKSSPDRGGTDLFVIHEGTEVRVTATLQEWIEITLSDGKKGWIEAAAVEMI